MRQPGVYKITNVVRGALYIGSSVNVRNRIAQHKSQLKRGVHQNPKMQHSWSKYGPEAFIFEVVDLVDSNDDLLTREQYWMDHYRSSGACLFNIALVAGNCLGVVMSEERKRKISMAKRGWKWSEEDKRRLSELHKGKKHTEESKRKISESKRKAAASAKKSIGFFHSDETRRKMSLSRTGNTNAKGNVHSEETKRKISEALTGKKYSRKPLPPGVKRKQSGTGMLGKKHSPETREKIAESNRRRWALRRAELV